MFNFHLILFFSGCHSVIRAMLGQYPGPDCGTQSGLGLLQTSTPLAPVGARGTERTPKPASYKVILALLNSPEIKCAQKR